LLDSDKPSVTFPDGKSVTVPAGAKSANFAVASGDVTATQVATITGKLDAVSKSATLTVRPVSISEDGSLLLRLTITPKSVLSGGGATGEVSLVSATDGGAVLAPAGAGTTVMLVRISRKRWSQGYRHRS
jgi:hypothetical protein